MFVAKAAVLAAFVLMIPTVRPASACSVCRCGDPAFNALGLNLPESGSWRLALDWDRIEKSQGSTGSGDGRERVVENRSTATIAYTAFDRITLVARLPFASRELSAETGATIRGRGVSDPELHALARVWSAPFVSGLGRRGWVGLQAGVKTPWGRNGLSRAGGRLDEHAQPGTGSTDWILGVAGVWVLDRGSSLFGSVQHRWTGANNLGYRYGAATLASLGYERTLGRAVDAVLEIDGRRAGIDRTDATGHHDSNTGGNLVYLGPKLVFRLSGSLAARLSAQVPVLRNLNGEQTEHTVWGLGVTWVPAT